LRLLKWETEEYKCQNMFPNFMIYIENLLKIDNKQCLAVCNRQIIFISAYLGVIYWINNKNTTCVFIVIKYMKELMH
jgi:hypothetical protein